jgi:cytochrome oxidase Cu insertion factor (SCO1/SenC/PrrC family)
MPWEVAMPIRVGCAAVILIAAVAALPAQQRQEGPLKVGDPAPALTADELATDKPVKLADLQGKPTVLVFGSCT